MKDYPSWTLRGVTPFKGKQIFDDSGISIHRDVTSYWMSALGPLLIMISTVVVGISSHNTGQKTIFQISIYRAIAVLVLLTYKAARLVGVSRKNGRVYPLSEIRNIRSAIEGDRIQLTIGFKDMLVKIYKENKLKTDKTLYIKTRAEWRDWLEKNFNIEREVWLVYAKKSTGEQRIQYNDAVEEALCFGWIDSTNKTLDEDHAIQRFTPRKAESNYSQPNTERLKWLAANNLIHCSLLEKVQDIISQEFLFPKDILDEIKRDKVAWDNYSRFSDSYKRIRVAYIDSARKRPEEFAKRLTHFIQKTSDNKLISGFGGIDKYY